VSAGDAKPLIGLCLYDGCSVAVTAAQKSDTPIEAQFSLEMEGKFRAGGRKQTMHFHSTLVGDLSQRMEKVQYVTYSTVIPATILTLSPLFSWKDEEGFTMRGSPALSMDIAFSLELNISRLGTKEGSSWRK